MSDDRRAPWGWVVALGAGVAGLTGLFLVALAGALGGDAGGPADGGAAGAIVPEIRSLEQRDGQDRALAPGGETLGAPRVRAVTSPAGGFFEVQVRPATAGWEASASFSKLCDPDGRVDLFLYVPAGAYAWRARTRAPSGAEGEWTEFEGPGPSPDFIHKQLLPFSISPGGEQRPLRLVQFTWSGKALAFGGETDRGVLLSVEAEGAAPGRMEVELKPEGRPFDGAVAYSSAADPGGRALFRVELPGGAYRWRARFRSDEGAAGEWAFFGGEGPSFRIGRSQPGASLPEQERPLDRPSGGEAPSATSLLGGGGRSDPRPSELVTQPPLSELLPSKTLAIAGLGALAAALVAARLVRRRSS